MQNYVGHKNLYFEKWVLTLKVWEPLLYLIAKKLFCNKDLQIFLAEIKKMHAF